MGFSPLAKSMGVTLYAQKGDFFSFANSPYYSHFHKSAVDIYPKSDNGDSALSPVDGVISRPYEFRSPSSKYFRTPETEQLILITPDENPSVFVRILHVKCNLQVGSVVAVGDCLGTLIRSGFFNFWTNRHLHVEVRTPQEPLRAKGGCPMEPINGRQDTLRRLSKETPRIKVKNVNEGYALAEVEGGLSKLGDFWGLGCTIDDAFGILDCGVPHYCHGGVHTIDASSVKAGDEVSLWGVPLGRVTQASKNFIQFKCSPISVYVHDLPLKGLSLYPQLKDYKVIKLIPKFPKGLQHLRLGETVRLRLTEGEVQI